jgi:hypothetical protein
LGSRPTSASVITNKKKIAAGVDVRIKFWLHSGAVVDYDAEKFSSPSLKKFLRIVKQCYRKDAGMESVAPPALSK